MKLLGAKNRSLPSAGASMPARRRPALSSPSSTRTMLGHGSSFQTTHDTGVGLSDYRSFSTTAGGGGEALPPVTSTSTHAAAAAGDDDLDDNSWMYSFGVESEAKAEERHNTRMENEACKDRMKEVAVQVKDEESVAAQLGKDRKYISVEMSGNLRSVQEMKIDVEVDETERQSLERSLRSNVMQSLVGGGANDASMVDDSGQKENDPANGNDSITTMTSKKFLQTKKIKMAEFLSAADKSVLIKIKNDAAEIRDEIAALRGAIVSESLEVTLQHKRAERDERHQELESETSRKQQIRSTIRELRAKGEQNALGLAAKRTILENNKAKAAAELAAKHAELEAAEAELRNLKTDEEWAKELAAVEKERDSIAQIIADAEAMIAKSNASKKERETVEAVIQDLKATEQELTTKLDVQKDAVVALQAELSKAQQDAEEAQSEKEANNQYQAEKVWPAESQIKDINEEKRQFTKYIEEVSAEMKADGNKSTDKKQEKQAQLEEVQAIERSKQEHLDSLTAELEDLSEKKNYEAAELEKDAKGVRSEIASVKMMTKEEETRLATLNDAKAHALAEATDTFKEAERHKGILEEGVKCLNIVAEFEQEKEEELEAKKKEIRTGFPSPVKPDQTRSVKDVMSQLESIVPSQCFSSGP